VKRQTILFLLLLAAVAAHAAEITTVIVVRHADRANITQNSPLSAAGFARANELARVLADVTIDAIYATTFVRTQQTVAPLAKEHRLQPAIFETNKNYERDLAADIVNRHGGGTVVVASHSDRIPDLLRALGVASPPSISMTEYDDLFVCMILPDQPTKLLTLRYGAKAR